MTQLHIAHVLVPGPFHEPLDYIVPAEMALPSIGARVLVPVRKKEMVGIVAKITHESHFPPHKLKWILQVLDEVPLFSPRYFEFLTWLASYYHAPLGDVCHMAMPKALREIKKTNRKRKNPVPKPYQHFSNENSLTLTASQQDAVRRILATQGVFQTFLLNGVTGSGKTEVYLQVIEKIISQGQQALVLVPEIGLTPQTIQRFTQRFGEQVAALHSGLNDTERMHAWLAAQRGDINVLVGTRSAIFAPFKNLGIIVIDEEHDSSFKQQESIRYSARDSAVVLGNMLNIPVVLGSATPSFESLHNVEKNRYIQLDLLERTGGAVLPHWHFVDLRKQKLHEGLSEALLEHIKKHIAAKKQVLLFLNRRGFAPAWVCQQCGWTPQCKHCDARLTYHAKPPKLICHYCGVMHKVCYHCQKCEAKMHPLGFGTQRLEEALAKFFPQVKILRVDRDSTAKKNSFEKLINEIHQGEPLILIGTQMLAKGHHFPSVTMVGVLNADYGLYSPDFRGPEHLAQLLLQVAGRAGRADSPGEVFVQTYCPEHELWIDIVKTHGYTLFAKHQLAQRKLAHLPPYYYLALVSAEAKIATIAEDFLKAFVEIANAKNLSQVNFLGPIPAMQHKRASYYRSQLLLSSANRVHLQGTLTVLMSLIRKLPHANKVRWSLDVDSLDIL